MTAAPTLRPYQHEAVAAAQRDLATHRSTLLVAATGTGKTVTFAELVRQAKMRGQCCLVLAHRDELIQQAVRKLEALGMHPEVERAKWRASASADCVVASVQTLRGPRLTKYARDHFGLIVVDEAHHATAPGYRAILDHFEAAKVLGVTATPLRADGQALGDVFDTVAYRYEIRQAIREGYLVPITARHVVVDGVDLSAVKTRAGDLAQDQLAKVLETEQAIAGVVVPLLELTHDRPTVVFGVDVAHAKAMCDALNDRRPGCARSVYGSMNDRERSDLLRDFEAGQFQYLCNCALLTEGWDSPRTACVAIARPTKSWALYVQMVGRGTRPCPETGKRDLLLLNFSGKAGRHRLVGPADALAGSDVGLSALDDDVRAELDRLLGTQSAALESVIAEATANAVARRDREAAQAVVEFHTEQIDPFVGPAPTASGNWPGGTLPMAWVTEPATEEQRAELGHRGVTVAYLPPTFSRADAELLLVRLRMRTRQGLCTLKQAKLIAKAGIRNTASMTFDRARTLCIMLSAGDYRPQVLWGEPEAKSPESAAAIAEIKRRRQVASIAEKRSDVPATRSFADSAAVDHEALP